MQFYNLRIQDEHGGEGQLSFLGRLQETSNYFMIMDGC